MTATSTLARPSIWSEMFTVRGRASRARYWLTFLLFGVPANILIFVSGTVEMPPSYVGRTAHAVMVVAPFLLIIPAFLAAIRRLHDRDRSGHWLWLFSGSAIVLTVVERLLPEGSFEPSVSVLLFSAALVVAALALSIWGFVEMGCLRGTQGPNRFGPDPLEGLSA